jgi:squalene-hopene/tetraprenyl-beta-curcumene cyclase
MSHRTESQSAGMFRNRAVEALRRVQDYFLSTQHPDGYWWGEMESNPTMEAEYLMLTYFVGSDEGERWTLIANDIRRRQRDDGSWGIYYGAPGDLSTSIECYFALKLAGVGHEEPAMRLAREFILGKGGVPKARTFTKIWLALFGQWEWKATPVMPPEVMLLPDWAPMSIYRLASWARATVVPMLVILTQHPSKDLPSGCGIDELYPEGRLCGSYTIPRRSHSRLSGEQFFLVVDKLLHLYERLPWKPFEKMALRKLERWVLNHQDADGSWGGIQPPWVYSVLALHHLGYGIDHPVISRALAGFRHPWSKLSDDGHSMRVQACLSPVWDTCLALFGLLESGLPPDHPALQRVAQWLLKQEIRVPGDWAVRAPDVEPSGWAFEFDNDMYPDIDDTAIVVMGLDQVRMSDTGEEESRKATVKRAVGWLQGMQSSNGGWAAFDKDNNSKLMAKMPFFDFGEVQDPPSADVTAHVMEMFGRLGYDSNFGPVRRALEYLRREQETDGCWFGRWGVNYVYGTGAVLPALRSIGEDMSQPYIRLAVEWLLSHQNDDGGWGETCASYADPSLRGRGESTASQTSWALIGLLATGSVDYSATRTGIAYLVATQQHDGTWEEAHFTGTGFPGFGTGQQPKQYRAVRDPTWQGEELGAAFMINYHLYRNYFPLWALGRYHRLAGTGASGDKLGGGS